MPWFSTIASVASVAGLVFSVLAWQAAQGAQSAARDARRAVRRGTAAQDLDGLHQIAKEFQGLLEQDNAAGAVLRARDLLASAGRVRSHWGRFLVEDSDLKLGKVQARVGIAARSLASKGMPSRSAEKERLLGIVHEVVAMLGEVSGRLLASIEESEE